ncbi:hypothetical protein AEP_00073 [Curvibacter sp. AEP1-3]|uniref:hypothetical protein n=1 Tax=Curvibacter sp. AEP1-3 TaxID=1844971 RepID=UPI000B3CC35D|nr:hypothetical protein [Curvibacter sp. AEP1-3]ARV17039.1 hypothetical protein AEP_00073 [Curvibacter sp. AEP1-3]
MQKFYIFIGFMLVATGCAAVLRWTGFVVWANDNPNMAAWVQAIGSIAAIFMAVWAVDRSHALETRRKKIEDFDALTQVLEGVFQLVGGAAKVARKIYDFENLGGHATPSELVEIGIELDAIANALSRVDPLRLNRHEFIEASLVAEMTLRRLKEAVDRVQSQKVSCTLEPFYLQNLANSAANDLEERAKKLAKITENRGTVKVNDQRPK